MAEVNASIITIGDELLIGQTIDTNSAFIAQELNKIGIWVRRRVAIADDKEAILKTLKEEQEESDVVIITGGLGPTADDITKPALCEYFETELTQNEGATENVRTIFSRLGRPITERNLSQGLVPANCEVLLNNRGTAPGMWWGAAATNPADLPVMPMLMPTTDPMLNPGGLMADPLAMAMMSAEMNEAWAVVSLPGVPHEMKGLIQDSVIPKLKETFSLPAIVHKTLLTAGQGESFIADRLASFEEMLPENIKLAYLPAYGMVRLRLTGKGDDKATVEQAVSTAFEQLKEAVKEWLVADEDVSIQKAVLQLLKAQGKTVATAESCTGGYIAHLLTSLPGSSVVYKGSVVSYANAVKQSVLRVNEETLQTVGAVSKEVVLQMAAEACNLLDTDYAIATSGVMGPDGGTTEKPVGTVWVAVASKGGETTAQQFSFRFERGRNIELTANAALNMLRKHLTSSPSGSDSSTSPMKTKA